MHPTNCLNCNANLGMRQHFCANCGQKADTHRLSLHEIGHDAVHHLTHADKGIFHLLKELALRPGRVAREYVDGKRAKYFKPVSFFLIVGTVLVFMTSRFHIVNDTQVKNIEAAAARIADPIQRQKVYGVAIRAGNVAVFTGKYSNVVYMLGMPFFAFIYWLLYRRYRYSYIEHVVANMYFISFAMLCYSLLIVPWQPLLAKSRVAWIALIVYFVFEMLYRAFAYYGFTGKKGFWQFMKALGIAFLVVSAWVAGTLSFIDYYVKHGL